jgi:membrane fusion protein, multidrug efflux system
MTKSSFNQYLCTVCLGLFGSGVFFGCSSSHEKESNSPAAVVEVVELRYGKITSSIKIPGELSSFRDVDLYAKVNSFVKQLYVDVGSDVKEGQLLAIMEAPELVSQLAAAHSRLESQTAIYKASKANYDRLLETSKTPGTVSQNDLDQALAKSNSDYSQLQAAQSAKKEIAAMQSYLEIRAPFDGIISAKSISAGAYVGPSGKGSDLPMYTLNEQKRLRLAVYIPEALTSYIHFNDEIQFTVKAYPNEKFSAKVKRLAGALDKRLRSQRVEMDVNNDNKKLLPGMIAEVALAITTENTLVVPSSALVNSTEKVFVIRVTNKKAEWVNVKLGLESKGTVEVFGPLSPGDQLVMLASEEVRDGSEIAQVKIIPN